MSIWVKIEGEFSDDDIISSLLNPNENVLKFYNEEINEGLETPF